MENEEIQDQDEQQEQPERQQTAEQDHDADEFNAEPGEYEPRESRPQQPHDLKLPELLDTSSLPDDFQNQLDNFGAVAAQVGLDSRVSQRLVNAFVDASQDMKYDQPLTGHFAQEQAAQFLRGAWGTDYDRKLALVHRAVEKLGPNFKTWLNETGYGNSPAALEAIARFAEGGLSLSKADAEKGLDAIYKNPGHKFWNKGLDTRERKRLVAEVRTLNEIANEDAPKVRTLSPTRAEALGRFVVRQKAATASNARAEAHKMLADRKHPLNNRHDPGHAAAVQQWHQLIAKIG